MRGLLALGARIEGNKPRLKDDTRSLSGRDLQDLVPRVAALLQHQAGANARVVLIEATLSIPAVVAYWAALHAGFLPLLLPANADADAAEIAEFVGNSHVRCVISRSTRGELRVPTLVLEGLLDSAASSAPAPELPLNRSDHEACALCVEMGDGRQHRLYARSHRSVALTGLVAQWTVGAGEGPIAVHGELTNTLLEWLLHDAIMARREVTLLRHGNVSADVRPWQTLVASLASSSFAIPEFLAPPMGQGRTRKVLFVDAVDLGALPALSQTRADLSLLTHPEHGVIGVREGQGDCARWFHAPLVEPAGMALAAGAATPQELMAGHPMSAQSGVRIDPRDLPVCELQPHARAADLATLLRASASQRPHAIALEQGTLAVSYGELLERSRRLAGALHSRYGVAAGDRVAFLALNRTEFFEAYLASAQLGALFVPLNFRLSGPEVHQIVEDCRPCVVIAERDIVERMGGPLQFLRDPATLLCMSEGPARSGSDYEAALAATPPLDRYASPDDEQPCSILYTAGTTGLPKGVVRSHKAVLWFGLLFCPLSLRQNSSATHLCTPPLFHIAGHETAAIPALARGRKVVVQQRFDPRQMVEEIESKRVTSAFVPPTVATEICKMLDHGQWTLSTLLDLSSGSAPISVDARDRLCQRLPWLRFKNSLGMTEAGGIAAIQGRQLFRKDATCVGALAPAVDLRITDESCRPVAPGRTGEIQIRSPQLLSYYWNREDATEAAFRDGWFHTGDLGYLDGDGDLHVVGRIKDMIITGGENVYAVEVEQALNTVPGVREAVVIGVPDPKWGESVVAWVVPQAGQRLTQDDVIHACRDRIAHYKCPRHCVFVDELPRNALGKVQKQQLKERWERRASLPV